MSPLEIGLLSGICASITSGGILYLVLRKLFSEVEALHNCLSEQKKAISDLALLIANEYQRSSFCIERRVECKEEMKDIRNEIKSQGNEMFKRLRSAEDRITRLEAQEAGNG